MDLSQDLHSALVRWYKIGVRSLDLVDTMPEMENLGQYAVVAG